MPIPKLSTYRMEIPSLSSTGFSFGLEMLQYRRLYSGRSCISQWNTTEELGLLTPQFCSYWIVLNRVTESVRTIPSLIFIYVWPGLASGSGNGFVCWWVRSWRLSASMCYLLIRTSIISKCALLFFKGGFCDTYKLNLVVLSTNYSWYINYNFMLNKCRDAGGLCRNIA